MLAVIVPSRGVGGTGTGRRSAAANVWRGRVRAGDLLGDRVRVRVDGTPVITAEVPPSAVDELKLDEGGEIWASVDALGGDRLTRRDGG